jgi:hypothetical protein
MHISKAPKINFGHVTPSPVTAPPPSAVDVPLSAPLPTPAPSLLLSSLVDVVLPHMLPVFAPPPLPERYGAWQKTNFSLGGTEYGTLDDWM